MKYTEKRPADLSPSDLLDLIGEIVEEVPKLGQVPDLSGRDLVVFSAGFAHGRRALADVLLACLSEAQEVTR